MAAKYEHLEGKLIAVSKKLEHELERAERVRLDSDKGTQLIRMDLVLPALSQIKFDAQQGWYQQLSEEVVGLPPRTRNIILKWGLTDLNLRRDYASLYVYQAGAQGKIDLTNYFFVGPNRLPPFGQMTEVIMPWDEDLESKLVVEFQCAQMQQYPTQQFHH